MKPETSAREDQAIARHAQKVVVAAGLHMASQNSRIQELLHRWQKEIEIEDRVNSYADKFIGVFVIALGLAVFTGACYKCYVTIIADAPKIAVTLRYVFLTLSITAICVVIEIVGAIISGIRVPRRALKVVEWSIYGALFAAVFAIVGVIPIAFIYP